MIKCTELSIFKPFARPIDSSKIETFNTTLMLVVESVNSALLDNDFSRLISSQHHIYNTLQEDLKTNNKRSVPRSYLWLTCRILLCLFVLPQVSDYGIIQQRATTPNFDWYIIDDFIILYDILFHYFILFHKNVIWRVLMVIQSTINVKTKWTQRRVAAF